MVKIIKILSGFELMTYKSVLRYFFYFKKGNVYKFLMKVIVYLDRKYDIHVTWRRPYHLKPV